MNEKTKPIELGETFFWVVASSKKQAEDNIKEFQKHFETLVLKLDEKTKGQGGSFERIESGMGTTGYYGIVDGSLDGYTTRLHVDLGSDGTFNIQYEGNEYRGDGSEPNIMVIEYGSQNMPAAEMMQTLWASVERHDPNVFGPTVTAVMQDFWVKVMNKPAGEAPGQYKAEM